MKPKIKSKGGRPPNAEIRLALLFAAKSFHVDRITLRQRLAEAVARGELKSSLDGKWNLFEIHIALSGNMNAAELRLKTAKAIETELANKQTERELIPREECARFIMETYAPIREFVVSMPGQLSAQVNPSDPQHARAHLERWRDEFLKLREKIPTGKHE